jgi:hypothetical protein
MLALAALCLAGTLLHDQPLTVQVDRKHHEVILVMGPFDIPRQDPGSHHGHGAEAGAYDVPLMAFSWPVNGWGNGFRYGIRDGTGRPLPLRLIHHLNVIHRGRRQLVESAFERTFAIGQETGDVQLPPSVGVRLEAGSPILLHLAWENQGDEDLRGVRLELRIRYLPDNMVPAPRTIHPVPLDVGATSPDRNSFDVPPGRSTFEREFVFPISGRMLGLGAHLHDYARSIRLEDGETGKVLCLLRTRADSAGRVFSIEREIYGAYGDGLRIRAGRRYRVVAEYDNPTSRTIPLGGMAILGGIFMPDDPRQWPAVDLSDPGILADLALLHRRSGTMHH